MVNKIKVSGCYRATLHKYDRLKRYRQVDFYETVRSGLEVKVIIKPENLPLYMTLES
jgi:hypothetical protein